MRRATSPIVGVRDLLGHCSVAVIDRYSHMIDQRRRALAHAMDGYMGQLWGQLQAEKLPRQRGQLRGQVTHT